MSKLERITVTMPEEMAARLRAAVDGGDYATTSEVVREALRNWSEERQRRDSAMAHLRKMFEDAREGPFYSAEEVFSEVRALVATEAARNRDHAE